MAKLMTMAAIWKVGWHDSVLRLPGIQCALVYNIMRGESPVMHNSTFMRTEVQYKATAAVVGAGKTFLRVPRISECKGYVSNNALHTICESRVCPVRVRYTSDTYYVSTVPSL